MSTVTMREMLEAGVHFGHQTRYWNPQMAPYLFGQRNKIHIINLEKTLPLFNDAVNFIGRLAAKKANILFVGTKRAAQKIVEEEATRCGMPYVNKRWLGGLLTNYKTVKQSINRLKLLEGMQNDGSVERMSKKEALQHSRELKKLQASLSGIVNMPGLPDAMIVIDVGYENIAVNEAVKLQIPVVGVVDSNNSPQGIDYIIPGNDDAIRSIRLYVKTIADAIVEGRGSISSMIGEGAGDEFVELDETGTPVMDEKKGRKPRKGAKKPSARISYKASSAAGEPPAREEAAARPAEKAAADTAVTEEQAATEPAAAAESGKESKAKPAEAKQDKPASEAAAKDDAGETDKKTARKKTSKKKTTKKKTVSKKAAASKDADK